MSTFTAYKCSECGYKLGDEQAARCPLCGGVIESYEAGIDVVLTDVLRGATPSVVGDKLAPTWDWAAGRSFNSRSERRKYYKAHGLRRTSAAEWRQHHDGMDYAMAGKSISYAGQTTCKSSGEKTLLTGS